MTPLNIKAENLFHYRDKLQLESWHNNKYLSEDMKNFYIDIIESLNDSYFIQQNFETMFKEIGLIIKFLDYRGLNKDYSDFKNYMLKTDSPSETEIKAFFRKQKIKKILQTDNV